MKVYFAPVYRNNPYQNDLMTELSKLGVDIGIGETGTKAFFATPNLETADIIHFHWFEPFVLGGSPWKTLIKVFVFLYRIKRLKGNRKFVWTVHNLESHEKSYSKIVNYFLKEFICLVDAFSVHNLHSKDKLLKLGVDPSKIYHIPHGNYINSYPKYVGSIKEFRKSRFEKAENKKIVMFLGNVRPYKGITDLILAFKNIKSQTSILYICGVIKFKSDRDLILNLIENEDNIELLEGYVPDNEISAFLASADLMVYPYKDILTSGALILGMSYGKMCIASNAGSMSELLGEKFIYHDNQELIEKLLEFEKIGEEDILKNGLFNLNIISSDSWESVAEKTFKMYNKIINK